jgi:hypothetical protein
VKSIVIASLFVLIGATTADAKTKTIWLAGMPPVQYDKPYTGKLAIQRFSAREKIPCKTLLACAYHASDYGRCYIAMASDRLLATEHHTYATALRHELGHCNGWPGDHERKRLILRESVKAPALPADTQFLPTG